MTRRDDAFTGMTLCTVPKASPRLGTAPVRAEVRRNANALATNENLPTTRTIELNNMKEPTLRNKIIIKSRRDTRHQDLRSTINPRQALARSRALPQTSNTNHGFS